MQLMLSEWMLEIPENFADDWVMVPCPVGKRSLVVASNVRTFASLVLLQFTKLLTILKMMKVLVRTDSLT